MGTQTQCERERCCEEISREGKSSFYLVLSPGWPGFLEFLDSCLKLNFKKNKKSMKFPKFFSNGSSMFVCCIQFISIITLTRRDKTLSQRHNLGNKIGLPH